MRWFAVGTPRKTNFGFRGINLNKAITLPDDIIENYIKSHANQLSGSNCKDVVRQILLNHDDCDKHLVVLALAAYACSLLDEERINSAIRDIDEDS